MIIYSLSGEKLGPRKDVLKTPIKTASEYLYLDKLKKLNELEGKKAELEHSVELKRKQDASR